VNEQRFLNSVLDRFAVQFVLPTINEFHSARSTC
jgi:hypothetical protein